MKHYTVLTFIVLITSLVTTGCKPDSKTETGSQQTATSVSDTVNQSSPIIVGSSAESSTTKDTGADANAWLLSPGVSAGMTRLNSDAEEVYKRLGTPDGGDAAMMKSIAIWYTDHNPKGNALAIYTSRSTEGEAPPALVKQIRVTSPKFRTKEGIGRSSSLTEIKKSFPTLKKDATYTEAGQLYTIYDSSDGITFEIGPDDKCVAVIIHEPGVNNGTYLKFR